MGVSATTASKTVIGAGNLFVDNVDVGATQGNGVLTIPRKLTSLKANGLVAPILGGDYVQEEVPTLEAELLELAAANLAYLLPGSASTTPATGVQGSPAFTATTLAATAVAGQQYGIKLTAVTGAAVGQFIAIAGPGSPALMLRVITRVGTLGAGGSGIDVNLPLSAIAASGNAVTQYTSDGSTQFGSGALLQRRIPTTAYHTFAIAVPGPNGIAFIFGVRNAINNGSSVFTLSDSAYVAPKLMVEGRIDPANPNTSPWFYDLLPADA